VAYRGFVRRQAIDGNSEQLAQQRALLAALSDDLALPLIQIKTALEVLEHEHFNETSTREQGASMALSASSGLQLIEAYHLALQAQDEQTLPLVPVSMAGVLQDVAHQLTPYAKQYDTELQVDVMGKLRPVLAHRPSLIAALQCLSASMIRAQAAQTKQKTHRLLLGAHRSPDNSIATGVFSTVDGLSDRTLRTARSLAGRARQPLPAIPAGAASGILIADMLCAAMWQPLRSAAHRNMHGLATAVPISKQLQFV
jgi:hypothetical protein